MVFANQATSVTMSAAKQTAGRSSTVERLRQQLAAQVAADEARGVTSPDGLPDQRVQFLRMREFSNSYIYWFSIDDGSLVRRLLVKVPFNRDARRGGGMAYRVRPQLFSKADPNTKAYLEFVTLRHMDQHFRRLQDDRFGTLRPVAVLPQQRAVVLPEVCLPTLDRLMRRAWRLPSGPDTGSLEEAFRNTGAWLSIWHRVPLMEHTRLRHTTRAEFLETIERFVDYLIEHRCQTRLLRTVAGQIGDAAQGVLPETLPVGLGHSDFGPSNVFVGPGNQIMVYDSIGRWCTGIYEDLGSFLFATKTLRTQVHSQGLLYGSTALERFEQAFLNGYFDGAAIPISAVRLYELQALLARWCALVHAACHARGVRRLAKRVRGLSASWFFTRYVRDLRDQVAGNTPPGVCGRRRFLRIALYGGIGLGVAGARCSNHGVGVWASQLASDADAASDKRTTPSQRKTWDGIWSSAEELRAKPMEGPAWEAVLHAARQDTSRPDVSNQSDRTNICVLAAAIVHARTGQPGWRATVVRAIESLVQRGQPRGRTLAWARETGAYALAADLVGYRSPAFEQWLAAMAEIWKAEDGRTLRSMFHQRPNNWGSHAFGTLCAIYAYLERREELEHVRDYWIRGVVGPNPGYRYGKDLSWHVDPDNPRFINPRGAVKEGMVIDGFFPDDMRRGGPFRNPPTYTNYVWGTQQGLVTAARILERRGMPIWDVADKALFRAAYALQVRLAGPWKAKGDDRWLLAFYDKAYGTNWAEKPRQWDAGKIAGWTYVL